MPSKPHQGVVAPDPLRRAAAYLEARHDVILKNWHRLVVDDRNLRTSNHLTRVQLLDHVPEFLRALTQSLRAIETSSTRSPNYCVASEKESRTAREHGVHRWQQGYDVWEVTREFSHLSVCIGDEIARFAEQNSDFSARDMSRAHRVLASCISNGVEESVVQFTRGREAEARARVEHLENVLSEIGELERVRGQALHAASHDMRGSLAVVEGAASMLLKFDEASLRDDLTGLMERSLESLQRMVADFMGLSRLEAGQESLNLRDFDAAKVLFQLCETSQPLASNFDLWLRTKGDDSLLVEGDEVKVARIAQNLLLNALKYTPEGGVEMRWEVLNAREWALHVADTGPGLDESLISPLVEKVREATEVGNEVDGNSQPEPLPTIKAASDSNADIKRAQSERLHPSEGIGLTIVKRLCEIVDARLEVESTSGKGTVFSVIFPRKYGAN